VVASSTALRKCRAGIFFRKIFTELSSGWKTNRHFHEQPEIMNMNKKESAAKVHPVVPREEWLVKRIELLKNAKP
jgi:hypothetical protein